MWRGASKVMDVVSSAPDLRTGKWCIQRAYMHTDVYIYDSLNSCCFSDHTESCKHFICTWGPMHIFQWTGQGGDFHRNPIHSPNIHVYLFDTLWMSEDGFREFEEGLGECCKLIPGLKHVYITIFYFYLPSPSILPMCMFWFQKTHKNPILILL